MDPVRIVALDGDETGQELLEESLRLLDPSLLGIPVEVERFDLSLRNRGRERTARDPVPQPRRRPPLRPGPAHVRVDRRRGVRAARARRRPEAGGRDGGGSARHGTAPALLGKDVANPMAMILAIAALLHHAEAEEQSRTIYEAVDGTLVDGTRTSDLGGHAGTTAFTDAVIERVREALAD